MKKLNMVNTSMKEYTAEDLITYKLQRLGIYIAKPKFDIDGTDLFAMLRSQTNTGVIFKYCRIQCKYRSLTGNKRNNVEIPEAYVKHDFIVFLYIEDGDIANNHLYCFLWEDMLAQCSPWHLKNGKYNLSISCKDFEKLFRKYVFDQAKVDRIKQRIETSLQIIQTVHGFAELTLPAFEIKAEAHVEA